jgi:hypothetical protein
VQFADVDGDGLLDLVVAAAPAEVYFGRMDTAGGIRLEETSTWRAAGAAPDNEATYLDTGRIGTHKAQGVVIAHNNCQVPSPTQPSRFTAYRPASRRHPLWQSPTSGCGSGVLLRDVDNDGWLDLIAGRWGMDAEASGAPIEIYRGSRSGFTSWPVYTSETILVAETISAADLRNRALRPEVERFRIDHPQAVITLSRQGVERIARVELNGNRLSPTEYTAVPGRTWISFARHLTSGDRVRVVYVYSTAPDLAVANFGATDEGGNAVIFRHR